MPWPTFQSLFLSDRLVENDSKPAAPELEVVVLARGPRLVNIAMFGGHDCRPADLCLVNCPAELLSSAASPWPVYS